MQREQLTMTYMCHLAKAVAQQQVGLGQLQLQLQVVQPSKMLLRCEHNGNKKLARHTVHLMFM
jgi:hypothetical protein